MFRHLIFLWKTVFKLLIYTAYGTENPIWVLLFFQFSTQDVRSGTDFLRGQTHREEDPG